MAGQAAAKGTQALTVLVAGWRLADQLPLCLLLQTILFVAFNQVRSCLPVLAGTPSHINSLERWCSAGDHGAVLRVVLLLAAPRAALATGVCLLVRCGQFCEAC